MMLDARIVLGHHIYSAVIIVDPYKIEVITNMKIPTSQREVRSFLGHEGYYWFFIKKIQKFARHYLSYMQKKWNFIGMMLAK